MLYSVRQGAVGVASNMNINDLFMVNDVVAHAIGSKNIHDVGCALFLKNNSDTLLKAQ
mgnify:CR=1 FL=1